MKQTVINRTDAIESESQSHHIVMIFGETFYTSRVADVAEYLVREGCLQLVGSIGKAGSLKVSKGI